VLIYTISILFPVKIFREREKTRKRERERKGQDDGLQLVFLTVEVRGKQGEIQMKTVFFSFSLQLYNNSFRMALSCSFFLQVLFGFEIHRY
jgi:hypothetical protein